MNHSEKSREKERVQHSDDDTMEDAIRNNTEIRSRISKFEAAVESAAFRSKVFERTLDTVYPNHRIRLPGKEMQSAIIHTKIVAGIATPGELAEWHWKITKAAAEKLCHVVSYFLMSGPLTEAEAQILNKSMALLKSYYAEKVLYVNNASLSQEIVLAMLYLPPLNSPAHIALSEDLNYKYFACCENE